MTKNQVNNIYELFNAIAVLNKERREKKNILIFPIKIYTVDIS